MVRKKSISNFSCSSSWNYLHLKPQFKLAYSPSPKKIRNTAEYEIIFQQDLNALTTKEHDSQRLWLRNNHIRKGSKVTNKSRLCITGLRGCLKVCFQIDHFRFNHPKSESDHRSLLCVFKNCHLGRIYAHAWITLDNLHLTPHR